MKKSLLLFFVIIICLNDKSLTGKSLYISDKNNTKLSTTLLEIPQKYSEKEMGVVLKGNTAIFRLFAPSSESVVLQIFDKPEDKTGKDYPMVKGSDDIWEVELKGNFIGKFYGFLVKNPNAEAVLCLDPYAKAVTSFTDYFGQRKGVIVSGKYDWGKDTWIKRDWRDAVIYEMHIQDLTAHPSSGAKNKGTYKGLTEENITGGLSYIKHLGVNTVELLPSQEFQNIELPFHKEMRGRNNTWNPYERNFWGYMTAAFFAPESYYADNKLEWGKWSGSDAKAVNDFKDMVKAFHKQNIAVVMDVVYNHLSEYEYGNLKEIAKEYYFRLDSNGNYRAESGCGNDLKTEAPMMRKLIIESILYWMKEYHIDGFRFDLGKLIDWVTVETIIKETRKINPAVIIVCEPWGGGWDPAGFSVREWGSWNDQIRNGIKGENPTNGLGWIFGRWFGNNNIERIKSYVNGTLTKDTLGLFVKPEHSVNYLESHDGYTFGDFIRLGLNDKDQRDKIKDFKDNAKLSILQTKLNKLGAMFLFTSRGITMIAEGQEFGRSKVIVHQDGVKDTTVNYIDANSYNKDNETNYLNFEHASLNKDLVDFYKGLIAIRSNHEAFRRADYNSIEFTEYKNNPFALSYIVKYKGVEYFVAFNANPGMSQDITLPKGKWGVLANEEKASDKPFNNIIGKIQLPASSGIIAVKK